MSQILQQCSVPDTTAVKCPRYYSSVVVSQIQQCSVKDLFFPKGNIFGSVSTVRHTDDRTLHPSPPRFPATCSHNLLRARKDAVNGRSESQLIVYPESRSTYCRSNRPAISANGKTDKAQREPRNPDIYTSDPDPVEGSVRCEATQLLLAPPPTQTDRQRSAGIIFRQVCWGHRANGGMIY